MLSEDTILQALAEEIYRNPDKWLKAEATAVARLVELYDLPSTEQNIALAQMYIRLGKRCILCLRKVSPFPRYVEHLARECAEKGIDIRKIVAQWLQKEEPELRRELDLAFTALRHAQEHGAKVIPQLARTSTRLAKLAKLIIIVEGLQPQEIVELINKIRQEAENRGLYTAISNVKPRKQIELTLHKCEQY